MKTVISGGYNNVTNQFERTFSDGSIEPVGHLYDSDDNEKIRPANLDEALRSDEAYDTGSFGHILVDGRRCYVAA